MWSYLLAAFGMLSNLVFFEQLAMIVLVPFGIHEYTIAGEREKTRMVLKTLQKNGKSLSQRVYGSAVYPSKLCVGPWFVAWINLDAHLVDCWNIRILCSKSYYDHLVREEPPRIESIRTQSPSPTTAVTILYRRGGIGTFRYIKSAIDISTMTPMGDQRKTIDSILDIYRTKRIARIFLHGPPGTGKSAVGLFLARELGGSYCHTFDPTMPGDDPMNPIGTHNELGICGPSILVLEEANKLIQTIHTGTYTPHKSEVVAIKDKPSWCTFLDDLVFRKNVIVILTSNQPPSDLDALDPAYLRPNRIDLQLEMTMPVYPS